MSSPAISVIICTYNRGQLLLKTLESLLIQDFPHGNFEMVVINNLSTDTTHESMTRFIGNHPEVNISYHIESQQGLSYSRNRGIKEAKAEILAFLDDDAYAEKNYLSAIHSFFSQNPDILAAGGKVLPEYEKTEPPWMSPFLQSLVSFQDLGKHIRKYKRGSYPIGANMIIRKRAFEKYGYFNTELGRKADDLIGGEEKDFFYRLHKDRQIIYYLPGVGVSHFIPEPRLRKSFINKLGTGIGKSEIIRLEQKGTSAIAGGFIKEGLKWGVTLFLLLYYCLFIKCEKGLMLVSLRYNISKGMILRLLK